MPCFRIFRPIWRGHGAICGLPEGDAGIGPPETGIAPDPALPLRKDPAAENRTTRGTFCARRRHNGRLIREIGGQTAAGTGCLPLFLYAIAIPHALRRGLFRLPAVNVLLGIDTRMLL